MRRIEFWPATAFVFLGVIWGSNFIFMKWAAETVSALQIVLLRVLFGFLPVALYALFTRSLKRWHAKLFGHFFVMSLLATVVYYYCFAKGATLLLSGVAGAVSGAIPLFAFVSSALMLSEEKVSPRKIAGILIGFAGVVVIANPFGSELTPESIAGVIYMATGSLSLGLSFVYAKKYLTGHEISPAALTTYQLGLALLILLLVTDFSGLSKIQSDPRALTGLVAGLGLLGTGIAYIAYYFIVGKLGAVMASLVTYIPPIVALLIGALLVGEAIAPSAYLATLLILSGVWLLSSGAARPRNSE